MDFNNKLKPIALPMKVYHRSHNDFEIPDPERAKRTEYGKGFYTAKDPEDINKRWGNIEYEYEFQGGDYFNENTVFDKESLDRLKKVVLAKLHPSNDEDDRERFWKNVLHDYFNENGTVKRMNHFIKSLQYYFGGYDIKDYLKQITGKDFQGLDVTFRDTYDHDEDNKMGNGYLVTFDPKTLKMVRKVVKTHEDDLLHK